MLIGLFSYRIINVIPFLAKLVKCRLMEENTTSKKIRRGKALIINVLRGTLLFALRPLWTNWAVVEIAEATEKSFGRLLITPLQCIQSCLTPILGISPSIGAVVPILKNYGQDCNLAVQWHLWKVSGQRERVREKHRETWRKVAIKVPTDQSINQQFGLDLPHSLSIPELSTVSRGNKWHMHEFFMPGPCIKRQDSQSPWRD